MTSPQELYSLALAQHRAGEGAAARRTCAQALELDSSHAGALMFSGVLHHEAGDHAAALRAFDAAARAAKEPNAAILANRAGAHLALGDAAAALADAEAALASSSQSFGATLNLGLACVALGRVGAAAAAFARAAALRPADARALLEWFSAAAHAGLAIGVAERVRTPLPALARYRNLALQTADELERLGLSTAAFAILAQLRGELPGDADVERRFEIEARCRGASASAYRDDSDSALAVAQALIAAAPWHCGARLLRAALLGERGLAAESAAEFARVVELAPDNAVAGSAYLLALQHEPAQSAAHIAGAHRSWAARHLRDIAPRWPSERLDPDPERPLRIGWLSPRFFAGLGQTFFAAELAHLERERMTHVLYDSGGIDDAATAQFRAGADEWRRVDRLDDVQLADQIRSDRIDVLVELSGHCPSNRLRALAGRPAPLQISWLDYFHSTGSEAVDVLLSDAVLSPPESFAHYSERVIHLPAGRVCYVAPADAPPVTARAAGPCRFASFNRLSKINDDVLAAWTRILDGVPGSMLKLKLRAYDDRGHRENFLARAAAHGIDAARLELSGYGSHRDALAAYGDVDIALDPFPFSGCATSCDALWMGVPVVTRIGDTMVGRQTASLLHSLALDELVATDARGYVDRALALAADPAKRSVLRAELRPRMRARLGDPARHARELCAALRLAWRETCAAARPAG